MMAAARQATSAGGRSSGWAWCRPALGAVVVLTTSTLNRVMVVELALPALLPGCWWRCTTLVQMLRPRMGHGSRRRRAAHALDHRRHGGAGGWAACWRRWPRCLDGQQPGAGIALAVLAFVLIGLGWCRRHLAAGAAGQAGGARAPRRRRHRGVADDDRGLCGHRRRGRQAARPVFAARLLQVCGGVCALALCCRCWPCGASDGRQVTGRAGAQAEAAAAKPSFRDALAQVWADQRRAPLHRLRVRVDAGLQRAGPDPGAFAGMVFGYTPGESTSCRACSTAAC
jgi:BCD family chlorophyll transporter-like MFS transporter